MADRCSSCGAPLVWIPTKNGKRMPCNAGLIPYKANPEGKQFLVTDTGDVVRCDVAFDGPPTGFARISHFATCPYSKQHRKRK